MQHLDAHLDSKGGKRERILAQKREQAESKRDVILTKIILMKDMCCAHDFCHVILAM